MTDVLALIDPAWKNLDFEYEMISPGESFPDLDGLSLFVDVETMPTKHIKKAALSPFHNAVFGVGVACPEKRKAWYAPLRHRAPGSGRFNLDVDAVSAWLQGIMSKARMIGNGNLKFDAKCLATTVNVSPTLYDHVPIYDPIIAATLIDERIPVNIQFQANLHLGTEMSKKDELEPHIVGNKDFQDWSYIPADLMARHNCGDVDRAVRLAGAQRALLARECVEDLFRLEMRVSRDLIHMELRGHRVDVDALKRDLPNMFADEIRAARRIEELVGASINYESPQEIADAFVSRLGLPILSHKPGQNKAGESIMNPVFDDAVMQTYARHYPQHAELMFQIRKARRLSTVKGYLQAYLEWQVDGAIHTTIKQVEARTGRESSEMPNLQNIAGEETWELPIDMREYGTDWTAPGCDKYFIAREGMTILSADYSQVEYRFFAHYLNDERLLTAYRNDPTLDMHEWTAREILNNMISRDDAKSANFGIVFGMGKDKLVKFMATNGVGISEQQAKDALEAYHARVAMRDLQQDVGRALVKNGHVRTILGRRRRCTKFRRTWGQKRDKKGDRGLEPYQGLNAICQGGAVDLLKHRSTEVREMLKQFDGELLLKIHDDVKVEVPTSCAMDAARAMKPILERFEKPDGTPYLKLPIYVKVTGTQTSWYDAKKLDLS